MSTRAVFCVAAFFAMIGLSPNGPAWAGSQQSEYDWKAIQDEPSRAVLFKRYAKSLPEAERGAFAFPLNFEFPLHALQDLEGKPRQNMIFGIDISHYDGRDFPFEQLKQQAVRFVYVKATQGESSKDSAFAHFWSDLASEHITRGAYHFLSADPDQSGRAQAKSFVDYVELHGGFAAGDLPPVLDLEWDVPGGCGDSCPDRWTTTFKSPAGIISRARAFLRVVKDRTHRIPMIYTNKSFLRSAGFTEADMAKLCDGYKVWIFDVDKTDRKLEAPDPNRNLGHVLWQFTWLGQISGHKEIDVNVFRGTEADFTTALLSD